MKIEDRKKKIEDREAEISKVINFMEQIKRKGQRNLIDAGALFDTKIIDEHYLEWLNKYKSYIKDIGSYAEGYMSLTRLIQEQPIIDAVEVVRCKDCIYSEFGECESYCRNINCGLNGEIGEQDFCSYGERK